MTETMRRTPKAEPLGILAQTYAEALRILDAQGAEGVSREERTAGLERTLRAAWPKGRVWHYLCEACQDTGWARGTCTAATPCGRPFRLPPQTNKSGMKDSTGQGMCVGGHDFVTPCPICPKGDTFRQRLKGEPAEEEVTTAGRRRGGWSRVGR